jgi:transcriptional regulator with XRE-family HTH domain
MLKSWLSANNLTQTQFAARLGVSTPHLSLLISGKKRPSLSLALKIERATNGTVPVSIWADPTHTVTQTTRQK